MQSRGDLPKVRLDLTSDEIIVLPPVTRTLYHAFSDSLAEGMRIRSYCFEEVFAEKIRALSDRLRPRDLYDVVHLYRHDELHANPARVLDTLKKKCSYKDLPFPNFELLNKKSERSEIEVEWNNMLGHQVQTLPPFEQFWEELPAVFEWLYGDSDLAK